MARENPTSVSYALVVSSTSSETCHHLKDVHDVWNPGQPNRDVHLPSYFWKKSQEAKKQMLSKKIFYLKKQHFEFDVDGRWTFFMRFQNIFSEEISPNPTKSFLRWRSQLDKKNIMVDLWYLVILDLLKNSSFPVFSHILNSVIVHPLNIESESSHRNFETSDKKCGPNLLD